MKRITLLGLITLTLIFVLSGMSGAVMEVQSYGETGWQTYSYTFDQAWSGLIGIGVSDEGDDEVPSFLLVDNLLGPGITNGGFESGFTGYITYGSGATTGSGATSYGGTVFTPTHGSSMAILDSIDGDSSAYTDFADPYLLPPVFQSDADATDGTWIEFWLDADTGDTVSFDWNFFTTDYWPLEDFAFLYAAIPGQGEYDNFEILAKIGTDQQVPEPGTLILLGSGLFGLGAYSRRKIRK